VRGLAIESSRPGIEEILATETLYEYAARQPDARMFKGRAPAYAISLPKDGGDVVVRHAMRGGALGKTKSDLFFPPTRALRELINSMRLRMAGVPTPEVVAFITYRAGPIFRRSDVATREIKDGHDLSIVLKEVPSGDHRAQCLAAAGNLLALLARVGAHHPDLNVRNVLLTWDDSHGALAHVLDVDRIRFHLPADPMVSKANFDRLERSLKKIRERGDISITDKEIESIRASASVTAR
ncbi:MAG TPA: lipopolysaccharide kinase InaA family protein, partial [Gemmatimonadaceae bacterium]|nr:lipopolysaccharide kinase InaA family protein [Gemmatimonadaceae bacterium]